MHHGGAPAAGPLGEMPQLNDMGAEAVAADIWTLFELVLAED